MNTKRAELQDGSRVACVVYAGTLQQCWTEGYLQTDTSGKRQVMSCTAGHTGLYSGDLPIVYAEGDELIDTVSA
jgi:hypothetical protein